MENFKELGRKLEKLQPTNKMEYQKGGFLFKEREQIEINNMSFTNYSLAEEMINISNYANNNCPFFDFCIPYSAVYGILRDCKTWSDFVIGLLAFHSKYLMNQ